MDETTMHSILITMKSSTLQYLDMFNISNDAFMFTLIVNGVQTKPVTGADDSLLLPLLIGLDTSTKGATSTSLELRYFTRKQTWSKDGGHLALQLPEVSLPISIFTAELRLPRQYIYNFTGSFGDTPSDKSKYAVPSSFSYVEAAQQNSNIQMNIPQTGRSYFFERLFVYNTTLSMDVSYHQRQEQPKLSLWKKITSIFGMGKVTV